MAAIPFIYVQLIALCCYGFLLCCILIAKKNELLRSFMMLLVAFIGWTAGSLFMRLLLYPGYRLWYEISLLSIFSAPVLMYDFISTYTGLKNKFLRLFFWTGTIILLFFTHFEVFLAVPTLTYIEPNRVVFLYNTTWHVLIPTTFFALIVLRASYMVNTSLKKNSAMSSGLIFVAIGMYILFAGNLLSVIPGNVFPFDTLSGIFYAVALLISLYKKRLFSLQLLVSSNTIGFTAAIFTSVIFFYFVNDIDAFIKNATPMFTQNHLFVVNLLFLVSVAFAYFLVKKLNVKQFRTRKDRDNNIKNYSATISKTLNIDEISAALISIIKTTINIDKIYICLKDEKRASYITVATCSPLARRDFTLREDNPCVLALLKGAVDENASNCLLLSEFSKSVHYKAMWEHEKSELARINALCLAPLKVEDCLYGIVVICGKPSKICLSSENINFLESVGSITSIAIKNAHLYEKVYNDARTDDLTGLLNRKFFHEQLDTFMEKSKNDVLSLLFLNVDDFKLYNQLYGYSEGDIALKEIANIIKSTLGECGKAVRYSGKVFAVILPGYDSIKALYFAEKIKSQLAFKPTSKLKTLTLSAGIATYPYTASSIAQLLQNVELAVYNAKFSGKNKIVTYASGKVYEKEIDQKSLSSNDKYAEYATTIHALTAAIDVKDHVTFGHSQRVAEYAIALGKELGLDAEHVKIIKEAALLHDIGKIGISEHILTKQGKLDDDEYFEMKKHVENSVEIIKHLPALNYLIPIAISHHERWDGRGYPRGIKGEDIPIGGRCLAIADAFDAMTSERQYKKPMPFEFAVLELKKNAGTQFDPKLAEIFIDLVMKGKISSIAKVSIVS